MVGTGRTDVVLAAFDELQARTAVAARAMLRELVPEGRCTFYDYVDWDGPDDLLFGRYLGSHDASFLLNEGLFKVVDELVSRQGTIVQPLFPAATGLRSHTLACG